MYICGTKNTYKFCTCKRQRTRLQNKTVHLQDNTTQKKYVPAKGDITQKKKKNMYSHRTV